MGCCGQRSFCNDPRIPHPARSLRSELSLSKYLERVTRTQCCVSLQQKSGGKIPGFVLLPTGNGLVILAGAHRGTLNLAGGFLQPFCYKEPFECLKPGKKRLSRFCRTCSIR